MFLFNRLWNDFKGYGVCIYDKVPKENTTNLTIENKFEEILYKISFQSKLRTYKITKMSSKNPP